MAAPPPNNNGGNESPFNLTNLAIFGISPAYGTFRMLAPETAQNLEQRAGQSASTMFDSPGRTALTILNPVGSFVYGLFGGGR